MIKYYDKAWGDTGTWKVLDVKNNSIVGTLRSMVERDNHVWDSDSCDNELFAFAVKVGDYGFEYYVFIKHSWWYEEYNTDDEDDGACWENEYNHIVYTSLDVDWGGFEKHRWVAPVERDWIDVRSYNKKSNNG